MPDDVTKATPNRHYVPKGRRRGARAKPNRAKSESGGSMSAMVKKYTPNGPVGWAVAIGGAGALGFAIWLAYKKFQGLKGEVSTAQQAVQQRTATQLPSYESSLPPAGPVAPALPPYRQTMTYSALPPATSTPIVGDTWAKSPLVSSQYAPIVGANNTGVSTPAVRGFDDISGEYDNFSDVMDGTKQGVF